MMSTSLLRFVVVFFALFPVLTLHAAEPGWYVGFSAGTADDDTLNESESAFKIMGGYNFTPNLSGEIAFVDPGKYDVQLNNVTIDRAGLAFQGIGRFPVSEQFDIFAKAGFYHWTVEFDLKPGTFEEDGGDFTYGFGAEYSFTRAVAVRAEYEEYLDFSGELDVSLLTLGILYHF